MTLEQFPQCSCGRNCLILRDGEAVSFLCPLCAEDGTDCSCSPRGRGECACGYPAIKSVRPPMVYACHKCGRSPDSCHCVPKEVAEFRSDEMFGEWLEHGDAVDFAMKKVAEKRRAENLGRKEAGEPTNYHPGDVVEVLDCFGAGPRYLAQVRTHEKDVRKGRAGGTGVILVGESIPSESNKWWYDEQVIRVVARERPQRISSMAGSSRSKVKRSSGKQGRRGNHG